MTLDQPVAASRAASGPAAPWWRDAVVYQVYVRSFADSNGDGVGDLGGICDRLDHLQTLGVDAIWLTPCYPSPQLDHGYDVADYFDIDPMFGDLATFDRLVAAARDHGIKVLMDVVPNHCSSQHSWFQAALAAPPGSPERARFFFRDGRGESGELPPNNWQAVFGGPAWTRVVEADGTPGQWYLHTFTPWQPDFDWDCPDVDDMFDRMLTFWFDRGVEGFRVDAVVVVGKAPGLPDTPPPPEGTAENDVWTHNPYSVFWPTAHDHWRRWRTLMERYEAEHPGRVLMTVSEAYTPERPDLLLQYVRPDEFHQSFCFDLMLVPWIAGETRRAIAEVYETLREADAALTWTLNNHDTQRSVTRYGRANAAELSSWTRNNLVYVDAPVDEALGWRRSRAAIALAAALPGALYLYQGEELGLPEVLDLPDEVRQDPIWVRTEGREIGRDGCRVPLPWTSDPTTCFGFSPSAVTPWLPQPASWAESSALAQEADPASMLVWYRTVMRHRRDLALGAAPIEWIDLARTDVLAFRRGPLTVVMNFGSEPFTLPADAGVTVLSSAVPHEDPTVLPGDACAWLLAR